MVAQVPAPKKIKAQVNRLSALEREFHVDDQAKN